MFVVIEGPNGSGKTSLLKRLGEGGFETLSSPNGTKMAKILRPMCRGTEPWVDIDKKVQFLLFSAARYDEYIRLVEGKSDVIVADRWWTSTYVYQCLFQGISIKLLEQTIKEDEKIDLVVLLDGDDDVLIDRVMSERERNPGHKKCTWTMDDNTIRAIIDIYRKDLPTYLRRCGISVLKIDVTENDQDRVFEIVKSKIDGIMNV
jgi:thymidylate kinase